MKKKLITAAAALMAVLTAAAQTPDWDKKTIASEGAAPHRAEFISFDIREVAEVHDRSRASFFLPLEMFSTSENGNLVYKTVVDIPYKWLDRDIFFHLEGLPEFSIRVNDRYAGKTTDSKTPAEFMISPFVSDGLNTITIVPEDEGVGALMEAQIGTRPAIRTAYTYSQPKVRLENVIITARPDSIWKDGSLNIVAALSNSYNDTENISVGYDIYTPQGKLVYYDLRDLTLEPMARDTMVFDEAIWVKIKENLWSPQTPNIFKVMVYVKHGRRIVEYIPFYVGFTETEYREDAIYRNGAKIDIRAARYNASDDSKSTSDEVLKLKAHGINTIYVDYPQPFWFYDLCDNVGMYVVDRANINCPSDNGNLDIDGTASNDPRLVNFFTERADAMYERNRNHACIVAWSLGADCGNGYNMYKAYQLLKSKGDPRPVVYVGAYGEWNSDITLPEAQDGRTLIETPAPAAAKNTKKR